MTSTVGNRWPDSSQLVFKTNQKDNLFCEFLPHFKNIYIYFKKLAEILCCVITLPVQFLYMYYVSSFTQVLSPNQIFISFAVVPLLLCYSGSLATLRTNFLFPLLTGGCPVSLSASGSILRCHHLTTELSAA